MSDATVHPVVSVRFWGVRGSIACPGPAWAKYGGNTSSVEIRCGEHRVLLDAGSGIRLCGQSWGDELVSTDLLLSHTHIDHIVGFPFFGPLYVAGNEVRVWSGHLQDVGGIESVLSQFMAAPLFPVPPTAFTAQVSYHDFKAGGRLELRPGIVVQTHPLCHPNGATGYRIEFEGRSVCYVTDTEHVLGEVDEALVAFLRDADVLIYDSTYTDAEFGDRIGWGHSTWQQAVRLADRAGVAQLVLFHHDPGHDDAFMDGVAAAAERERPGTVVAHEGLCLTL